MTKHRQHSTTSFPLKRWFIPADSDRLIIHNHFLPGNRHGYPGHLPGFGGLGASSGTTSSSAP